DHAQRAAEPGADAAQTDRSEENRDRLRINPHRLRGSGKEGRIPPLLLFVYSSVSSGASASSSLISCCCATIPVSSAAATASSRSSSFGRSRSLIMPPSFPARAGFYH